eukprot:661898-Rhodomonas_salina.2
MGSRRIAGARRPLAASLQRRGYEDSRDGKERAALSRRHSKPALFHRHSKLALSGRHSNLALHARSGDAKAVGAAQPRPGDARCPAKSNAKLRFPGTDVAMKRAKHINPQNVTAVVICL